ncbi:hypothetical protein NI18_06535 [Sphingomonas sp. Ant20]|nr:hypothetical protein NI18_06535 [Sphingomonas sp. Ant20]
MRKFDTGIPCIRHSVREIRLSRSASIFSISFLTLMGADDGGPFATADETIVAQTTTQIAPNTGFAAERIDMEPVSFIFFG